MPRTACTARRATSRNPTRIKLPGSRPRAVRVRITRAFSLTGETQTVGARWRSEVAADRLQLDSAQEQAALQLDRVAERLRREPRWLDGWRRRLGTTSAHRSAARGLYLWGGVGRGKTLLMDAFFASLGAVPGERTHFYRFMRNVHEELGRVKGTESPLDRVARRIAKLVRVLCLDEFFVADIADAMILSGLFDGLF